jgi:hypothetical protein
MTPKEKAQELLSKYTSITLKEVVPGIFLAFDEELCKKFALIAVDEVLQSGPTKIVWEDDNTEIPIMDEEWWESVKQEIEKL